MLRNIGGPEILIVLVIIVLLFGARKLPELARSIGASARELRAGMAEGEEGDEGEAGDEAASEETPTDTTS